MKQLKHLVKEKKINFLFILRTMNCEVIGIQGQMDTEKIQDNKKNFSKRNI